MSTLLAMACAGDSAGPGSLGGSLRISTSTTGPLSDRDGFEVTLNGADRRALPSNGTIRYEGLSSGSYQVGIDGVAPNCETPAPVQVQVSASTESRLDVDVRCSYLVYAHTTDNGVIVMVSHLMTDTVGILPFDSFRMRVTPDDSLLYLPVVLPGQDRISVLTAGSHDPVRELDTPSASADFRFTPDGRQMVVADGEDLVFRHATTNAEISRTTVAQQGIGNLQLASDGELVFFQDVSSVAVVETATGAVLDRFDVSFIQHFTVTSDGGMVIALSAVPLDPDTYKATFIDVASGQELGSTLLPGLPNVGALVPDESQVLITHSFPEGVVSVDMATRSINRSLQTGRALEVVVTPDGTRAYVSNPIDEVIYAISLPDLTIVRAIPSMPGPRRLVIAGH